MSVEFETETFKPIVSLTEIWMKTVENTTRDFTVKAIQVLSEKYNFPVDEAVKFLGLENTAVQRKPMTKRTKTTTAEVKDSSDDETIVIEESPKEEKVKKAKKS
jgi:hypothetical protein